MLKSPAVMRLLLFSSIDKVIVNASMKCLIFSLYDLGGLCMFPIVSR